MAEKSCVVLGDILIDLALYSDHYPAEGSETLAERMEFRQGGSGCATAIFLQLGGTPTSLATSIGTDTFADFALRNLEAAGVDTSLVQRLPDRQTGFFMILITTGGQRTMFGNRGANVQPVPLDALQRKIDTVDHLHVSGYNLLEEDLRRVTLAGLNYAHERGVTISLDPGVHTAQEQADRVLAILPKVTWFLPSQVEAQGLLRAMGKQTDTPEEIIPTLLENGCGAVALKLGSEGSAYGDGGDVLRVPAEPEPGRKVWNTTGAGDSFNAGFLKGMLAGEAPLEALRMGNRSAYAVITSEHGIMDLIGSVEK